MKEYCLVKKQDGRVVLTHTPELKDELLETITANTWRMARSKVVEIRFWNTLGHGWRCR